MSNEAKGKATVISDETFELWKNLVINNMNKIIVTVHPVLLGMKEPKSKVVTFVCGLDKVLVRSRNYNLGIYMPGMDRVLTLSMPYECD